VVLPMIIFATQEDKTVDDFEDNEVSNYGNVRKVQQVKHLDSTQELIYFKDWERYNIII